MKKILTALSLFIIYGAYAATHLDTENRLWFNADVVKSAIVEFVPESKQQPTADLYQDLMDQTTGKISVDSLFKVCRKAGFNTYKYEGFTQCKSFIQKMLMDAEVAQSVDLNGFCPGLDEKGNNPNKLRSITDKTRIGDFCSSTNIRMGQVIFKPGYNCSCMASVCNPGFEFQGGACVTRIADGNGDCLREAYPKTSENNYLEKCKSFCEKKYAGRACKYTSVVMSHSTNQCICNPNSTEIDAAYESMHQAKEKQINNLKYYEVCGDHKGKSGGTEVCVEGVFNWVNIGRLQASGLAEEYARVRYKDTVHCDTVNIRTSWNDDYVKCTSMNSKRYYEFQFDDVKESIDSAIQKALVLGICKIHNASSGISKVPGGYSGSLKCNTACTSDMTKTARVFGLNATTSGNDCKFSGLSMNASDAESKLAKIDGIDSYVFFHGIQIQGSQNVISQLRQYIKSTGKTVRTFDCNKNVGEIKNSLLAGDDDVLRCKLNGQPIDFVFDDFSESWLYVQEVGESKMQCIVSGGKFAGQECYGLTQKQCTDANAIYLKQNPGASGFRWDGKECVSIDANEAQFYDGAIQVGTGAIALVDCVVGTHVGCVLVMVETAGLATEMTTGVAIENRAGEFLSVSTRCKKRDCAISTIQNAGHVLSVMGALDATSLDSVDKELARLVGYLEPEDLSGVSDGDWNAIVTQLGGDPEDAGGTALKWLNRIGLGAQFLSIGAAGLRLTAQAITKLASKGSRIGRTASMVARALDTTGDVARTVNNASDFTRAANNTSDAGRAANNASDAGRAANNAGDAGRAANNAGDALHADISAYRNAANKNRARAKYHPDKYATSSASIQSKAQDIFQKLDNIDNMSDDELRALSRLMSEFDAEVAAEAAAKATAAAADVSRATTNAATDGARTTNTTADAARTTSRATNAATDGARMFGRTNVDDIGMIDKGWERVVFDGVDRFRHKKITYPEEADDVRRALEATKGQHNLAYMGVKDGYIVIAYESDLERAWPAFNKAVSGMTDAARTTSRTTNAATDGARMFGRTNVDDIGMVDKGWERAVFDGVDRFRHKKITYPEEADDVRRALEATKGQHNLAYMGVKDGYIVIAYESDLERAWPAFNKAVSGMTDAARTTSRATNAATDGARTANATTDITKHSAKQIINETKEMTYAEKQSLFAALSYDKKLEIAQLKVNSGEIQLPYGLTVDDLAKDPDLLNINGSFQPFDSGLAETQRLKRLNPESQDVDDFLFDETVKKYVDNPSSKLAIEQYGQDLRTKYLDIFKEDTDLRDMALRYDALTKTDKAALGELVLHDLKGKLGIDPNADILVMVADETDNIENLARQYLSQVGGATPENVDNLTTQINSIINNSQMGASWNLSADKNLIFLNAGSSELSNFDGYMTYLSHEMGHITQAIAPEVTSAPQIMSQTANYRGLETGLYWKNATEHESWEIQKIIGNGFTQDLLK